VRGIPQLRSYDITMPDWVDTSVPEQRVHLRLYYSDMLAAKPVEPPVTEDCDTWEVEEMKKFVFQAKPRTRLDAYPLLVVTQDVFRRVAEKEIRIVSEREAAMEKRIEEVEFENEQLRQDLAIAKKEIDHLKITAKLHVVTSMMMPKSDSAEAVEAFNRAQAELESFKAEQQRMREEHKVMMQVFFCEPVPPTARLQASASSLANCSEIYRS
jgi:hypothetical protein